MSAREIEQVLQKVASWHEKHGLVTGDKKTIVSYGTAGFRDK